MEDIKKNNIKIMLSCMPFKIYQLYTLEVAHIICLCVCMCMFVHVYTLYVCAGLYNVGIYNVLYVYELYVYILYVY